MGIFSLFLCLALLIYLSFKGVSVLILGAALSMLMVAISGDMPFLYALTGPFMSTTASYIGALFPIFLAGAVFGKVMEATGAAKVIAHFISEKLGKEKAILAVVLATSLLTYGGVSLFVVVFAVYPLGVALFQEANVPKRFLPAAIALGAFTFTMTAMPGSPQFLNSMPTNYLGTDIYAAPILGIIASLVMLVLGVAWLNKRVLTANSNGEGYGVKEEVTDLKGDNTPSLAAAITPIAIIFILNWILVNVVFKNPAVLSNFEEYGGINGNWPVTVALIVAIATSFFLFKKQIPNANALLTQGANSCLAPLFNTAVIVGFGGVVKSTAAFEVLKNMILSMDVPGLFKVGISTSMISGIVGSSSGGTGIALEALSTDFLAMGINPEAIHRIMLIAAGGLDSLPHSGGIVTLLAVCSISHKKGYADIGVLTVVLPVLSATLATLIYIATGIV